MSHTEGPWFVREVNDGIQPKVFVTREFGCEVPPKFYIAFLPTMAGGDSLADARLIAEAPAMLAALKELLAVDDRRRHPLGMPDEGIAYDAAAASANARGAISRAEGKS